MNTAHPDTQQLQQLNRMYRTLSRFNHHLIRAEDEQTLAQDFCSVMVEEGGYRMAWVGYAENDEARSIRPIAYAGFECGYLENLNLTWADTDRGSGPGARCIREQTIQVTRDIVNDPRFVHWREEAARRGYVSSIALPLKIGTGTVGFLGIYSERSDAFDEEEIGLLTEAADDLAYGITALRNRRERKELADALEEAARFNRATLDGLSSHIAILDQDGAIIAVNKPWEDFASANGLHSGTASIGANYLAVCDRSAGHYSEEGAVVAAGIRAVLGGVIPKFALEYPCHGPSEQRWFVVRVTPFPGRESRRAIVAHENITERKRSEEAVSQSEERLRLMIEAVSDHAIFILDSDGHILTWGRGAEQIGGYSAEEIIGRHYSCLFTPEGIVSGLPQRELELAAVEGRTSIEGWRLRKNGSRFWANGTLAALYDNGRRVKGFAKIIRDLTAKRRNDELLHSILDHTLDAIISIDERGTISMFNRAGEKLFGYAAAEVVGQNVNLLMPEPYRPAHDGYIANYLRTGEAKVIGIGREVQGLRKDGSTFPLDLAVTEFRLDDQRHFVGIVRDISEKKLLEAQIRQAQKMEAFGQLAGGVAHDFNNLLTIITGYSELLLQSTPAEDPKREILEHILRAGERSGSLTRQLLAFSRKQVLAPKVLDLNDVVRHTEKMLRRVIGEDIQLTAVLHPQLGRVKADPGQLEQVLLNLAVNARDAMPQGGKLTIETNNVVLGEDYARSHSDARPGAYTMLAVTDTGIGMTEDVKRRLFEPFFTTKGPGMGTGLGLAVVHGIVKQSDGSIEVYSEPGVGTSFKIYLPHVEDARPTGEPRAGLGPPPRGTETILLVEDEDAVRGLTRFALHQCGYTVLVASHGEEAIRIATNHRETIHLLVTDVVMPGMGGRVLAERLLSLHPETKVLYLSGYTDDAVVRHGILHEQVNFMQKPFSPTALAHKVRQVLSN